jgi:hypothetical protein
LVGPLPGEYASLTMFTAGIGASTKAPDAEKSLIQFLMRPVAAPLFKAKGFQPDSADCSIAVPANARTHRAASDR